jgi:hypothetical protein
VLQSCLRSALAKYDTPLLFCDTSPDRNFLAISKSAVKLVFQFLKLSIEILAVGTLIFCSSSDDFKHYSYAF